jgi:hypothetical protein
MLSAHQPTPKKHHELTKKATTKEINESMKQLVWWCVVSASFPLPLTMFEKWDLGQMNLRKCQIKGLFETP